MAWYSLPKPTKRMGKHFNIFLSIIIPVRNEEKNIARLLDSIKKQEFPSYLYEIICIDDHSEDNTLEIIQQFKADNPDMIIQVLHNDNQTIRQSFKKAAITQAVKVAAGELIITTDGDTIAGQEWLSEIVKYYLEFQPKMIVGPVQFVEEKNFFEKLQSIEFLSLIGVTAGAIGAQMPLMCNGANLIYQKAAFEEVNAYENDNFTSGDDLFLMLKIKKKFGAQSIRFLKSPKAIISTFAQRSLPEFIRQRTRWASKNKKPQWEIIPVASLVFITNLSLIILLVLSILQLIPSYYLPIFWGIKMIIDFPLVYEMLKFTNKQAFAIYYLPLTFIYPWYIVLSAVNGIFGNFTWKKRTYSR
jgi:cellulose synthase/poly-beta-1,6-N-acetylglucosamine synthase-like glycosyltransferase